MKLGKVGWPGLVIWSSKNSVVKPIQMNKVSLLRCLWRGTLFSHQNGFPDAILKCQEIEHFAAVFLFALFAWKYLLW